MTQIYIFFRSLPFHTAENEQAIAQVVSPFTWSLVPPKAPPPCWAGRGGQGFNTNLRGAQTFNPQDQHSTKGMDMTWPYFSNSRQELRNSPFNTDCGLSIQQPLDMKTTVTLPSMSNENLSLSQWRTISEQHLLPHGNRPTNRKAEMMWFMLKKSFYTQVKRDLILQVPCSCMAGIAHCFFFFFQKVPNYGNFIITLSLWTTQKNMQLGLHSEWSRHMSKVTLLMNWRPASHAHLNWSYWNISLGRGFQRRGFVNQSPIS